MSATSYILYHHGQAQMREMRRDVRAWQEGGVAQSQVQEGRVPDFPEQKAEEQRREGHSGRGR
jgi:hypothetical protein